MAQKAGKIWREYGALDYRECIADDVGVGKVTSFPSVTLKPGETVAFSSIAQRVFEQAGQGLQEKRPFGHDARLDSVPAQRIGDNGADRRHPSPVSRIRSSNNPCASSRLHRMTGAGSGASQMATSGQRTTWAPCRSSIAANTSISRVSGTAMNRHFARMPGYSPA